MSILSNTLSTVNPWKLASLPSESVCQTTASLYIGLDDPKSGTTDSLNAVSESDSPIISTAKIINTRRVSVSILKYGLFVESIQGQARPSQCDFVLYNCNLDHSSFSQVLLTEVKVCKTRKQKARRREAKDQLSGSLGSFLEHVPNMRNAVIRCAFFHCSPSSFDNVCSNTPQAARRAAQGVNRVASRQQKGIQKECPQIKALGAEFWEFPYGHVCDF